MCCWWGTSDEPWKEDQTGSRCQFLDGQEKTFSFRDHWCGARGILPTEPGRSCDWSSPTRWLGGWSLTTTTPRFMLTPWHSLCPARDSYNSQVTSWFHCTPWATRSLVRKEACCIQIPMIWTPTLQRLCIESHSRLDTEILPGLDVLFCRVWGSVHWRRMDVQYWRKGGVPYHEPTFYWICEAPSASSHSCKIFISSDDLVSAFVLATFWRAATQLGLSLSECRPIRSLHWSPKSCVHRSEMHLSRTPGFIESAYAMLMHVAMVWCSRTWGCNSNANIVSCRFGMDVLNKMFQTFHGMVAKKAKVDCFCLSFFLDSSVGVMCLQAIR